MGPTRTWTGYTVHLSRGPGGTHHGVSIIYKYTTPPRFNYCWWLKSCTSLYVVYPIIYRVSYIPGGARFQPSTVAKGFWKMMVGTRSFPFGFRQIFGGHFQPSTPGCHQKLYINALLQDLKAGSPTDYSPPKFNSSPLKKRWLEDYSFMVGLGNSSGVSC